MMRHRLQSQVAGRLNRQVAFLLKNNCDEMQGYHFSKPVSAQAIEELLDQST